MTWLIPLLIAVPLVIGAGLLRLTGAAARARVVLGGSVAVMVLSVLTVIAFGGRSAVFVGLPGDLPVESVTTTAEFVLAATVIGFGVAYRRVLAPLLAAGQLLLTLELVLVRHPAPLDPHRLFWFDRLTAVMVLVIGIIGPLICIQAIGYMRDYHRTNPGVRGRRTVFFALLFVFLGAMFGLVLANSLPVLLVFWELTTLCSFWLIGYTRTEQTIGYAFRALNMNMLGGLAFSLAIVILAGRKDGLDLARLTASPATGILLPAAALLALAGLTKSAQMPFSDWLIGAMYAPTPTSALLHSSTMVKAGVFLLLRLAPAIAGSVIGSLVSAIGMLTFLFASVVAVTERNAKKILAYSTIGYLGLITGCAGVGTAQAVWVGVMVVIFHAIAKGLLFLVVGSVENRLYTKDVEHFDSLLSRLPRVSVLALTGIAGMFIAPFGIVVAKWAAVRAFLELPGWQGAGYVTILAFASSFTIFYWGKLLIKILAMRAVGPAEQAVEGRVSRYEWAAEGALAGGVVLVTALLAVLSDHVVRPFALAASSARALGSTGGVGGTGLGAAGIDVVSPGVIGLMLVAVLFLPAMALWVSRRGGYDESDFYASGRTGRADHVMGGALGGTRAVTLGGYYLEGVVDGGLVFRIGTTICGLALVALALAGLVVR